MADAPFLPDAGEDWLWILSGLVLASVVLGSAMIMFTTMDGHVRFAASNPGAYFGFSSSDGNASELVFDRDAQRLMNDVSRFSVGQVQDVAADERLFCFGVVDGRVRAFRLADNIMESEEDKISGGCRERLNIAVDGFVHSQPGHSSELSKEDKSLESPSIDYTCIQFAEIVVSPSGAVGGLRCWKVVGDHDDPEFAEVDVAIRSTPTDKNELSP